MDDKETLNRRARLRELIESCFDNSDKGLLDHILLKTGIAANQGELSAIQKDHGKSFGDKKAKRLTELIGLHRRWFDFPSGTNVRRDQWLLENTKSAGSPPIWESSVTSFKKKRKTRREESIDEIVRLMAVTNDDGIKAALLRMREFASEFPLINKQTTSSR